MSGEAPAKKTAFNPDDWAWVASEELVWTPAQVVEVRGGEARLREAGGGGEVRMPAEELELLERAHPAAVEGTCDDMVRLEELNEAVILHTLRERYARDDIYTHISSILVSINPYRALPIYGEQVMRDRCDRGGGGGAPHCYGLAHAAYAQFTRTGNDQSVVISGESGSGKTEATKIVLRYLSFLSERAAAAAGGGGAGGHGVEEKIVMSNPIIEAFGNAKTVRNNNSSRFGKWIEIHYDSQHRITGGSLRHYLLEKSRVVTQGPGERNYHVFYQLLGGAAAGDPLAEPFRGLGPASAHAYLHGGGDPRIEGVDDAAGLSGTAAAMRLLGFSDAQVSGAFATVAAILRLGDVRVGGADKAEVAAAPGEDPALDAAVSLLGADREAFARALTGQPKAFGGETIYVPFTPQQARDNRDAFAKQLYGRMFDWIIRLINENLETSQFVFGRVGVLDIFGFEIFESNSLEQFLINFANEKLQQHFNHFVFEMEQAEYKREEVDLEHVTYQDNSPCIDLIEKAPRGLIPLLDEEVALPKGGDANYLARAHEQHAAHANYEKPRFAHPVFTVLHYAGGVEYAVDGFVEKNKDRLQDGLVSAVRAGGSAFLAEVLRGDDDAGAAAAAAAAATTKTAKKGAGGGGGGGSRGKGKGKKGAAAATLGSRFKGQLASLMGTLNATDPHFVRCIKPNTSQSPSLFDSGEVLRQLRYAGIEAVIRIRKQGFPVRMSHRDFVSRYRVILQLVAAEANAAADPDAGGADGGGGGGGGGGGDGDGGGPVRVSVSSLSLSSSAEAEQVAALAEMLARQLERPAADASALRRQCGDLVEQLGLAPDSFKLGLTKVFLTQERHAALEDLRGVATLAAVLAIQRVARGHLARRRVRVMRKIRDNLASLVDRCPGIAIQARLEPTFVRSVREALERGAAHGLPRSLPQMASCAAVLAGLEAMAAQRDELARVAAAAPRGLDAYDALLGAAREAGLGPLPEFAALEAARAAEEARLARERERDDALDRAAALAAAAAADEDGAAAAADPAPLREALARCLELGGEEARGDPRFADAEAAAEAAEERLRAARAKEAAAEREAREAREREEAERRRAAAEAERKEREEAERVRAAAVAAERTKREEEAKQEQLQQQQQQLGAAVSGSPVVLSAFQTPVASRPTSDDELEYSGAARPTRSVAGAIAAATSAGRVAGSGGGGSGGGGGGRDTASRKLNMRLRVQEMLIEKLQEKISTLEDENGGIRQLYRELNHSLFEKLGEYDQYRTKVSVMEKDYMARLSRLRRRLKEAEAETVVARAEAADAARMATVAAAASAKGAAGAGAARAGDEGAAGGGGDGDGKDSAAVTLAAAAADAAAAMATEQQGRIRQLESENAALVADFGSKCEQFMQLQLELDDARAEVDEERAERLRLSRQLHDTQEQEARVEGGARIKDLVLGQTQERIALLEKENARLAAECRQRAEETKRKHRDGVRMMAEIKRLREELAASKL